MELKHILDGSDNRQLNTFVEKYKWNRTLAWRFKVRINLWTVAEECRMQCEIERGASRRVRAVQLTFFRTNASGPELWRHTTSRG